MRHTPNSGQIKVAAQRAAHLNLSPRRKTCPVKLDKFFSGLPGESSVSSRVDALVRTALRGHFWRWSGRVAENKERIKTRRTGEATSGTSGGKLVAHRRNQFV